MILVHVDPARNLKNVAESNWNICKMILTGFHSIEERIRSVSDNRDAISRMTLYFSKPGPRVKKILELAKKCDIKSMNATTQQLDAQVASLPETARDHRGLLLVIEGEVAPSANDVNFDDFIATIKAENAAQTDKTNNARNAVQTDKTNTDKANGSASVNATSDIPVTVKPKTVVILDSVTDPHNVGAIIRSCDQFGVTLVILPEKRGAKDSEVISRASAGAASWVPVAVVTNLVRAVQSLKDVGFWVYGADAGGTPAPTTKFSDKTAIVMGSEGSGISRLLSQQCDTIVSIPTCGKLDSLNVSVAAGILIYEIATRRNQK